ncbi:MAG: hypothetical protein F6K17_09305 [Okeania sp. SIO3C4]|nr:hypothetical protein [Okeania sp. SIO3C4]
MNTYTLVGGRQRAAMLFAQHDLGKAAGFLTIVTQFYTRSDATGHDIT